MTLEDLKTEFEKQNQIPAWYKEIQQKMVDNINKQAEKLWLAEHEAIMKHSQYWKERQKNTPNG